MSIGTVHSTTKLEGLFKEVYGDKVENLVPECAKLVKLVKFEGRDKELGNKYHQPVKVAESHGFTYAAPAAGAFALNNHIAMTLKDAVVDGYQLLLRDAIDYEAAAKASGGKKAFAKATSMIVKHMVESMTKRLEIEMFYGGSSLGATLSSANASATKTVVTLTAASMAPGIWAGSENAELNFYTDVPALVSSAADAVFSIESVNIDDRKLTIVGTTTGITALDIAIGAGTCTLHWKGSVGAQMSGLDKILTNAGSLFGIDAAAYNLWKANNLSLSGQFSMAKILRAVSRAVNRGLDEDVVCFVNPYTWQDLHADQAALRVFDGSYKPSVGESGVEKIVYHGQNGKIEVMSHSVVKAGEAFILPLKRVVRIGAQDVSFKFPGFGEQVFFPLPSNAGYEMRLYTDQALFLNAPAKCVKVTGIVNSI